MKKLTPVLLFFAGAIFGLLCARGGEVQAQEKRNIYYEIIAASREGTVEKELNDNARLGCVPLMMSGATETVILLECPN